MMNTHGIIGSDGTIQKGPVLIAPILFTEAIEDVFPFPEVQDIVLLGNKIYFAGNFLHHDGHDPVLLQRGTCLRTLPTLRLIQKKPRNITDEPSDSQC
jgi:hypothetical protein